MKDRFERLHEENQQVFLPQNPIEILRRGKHDGQRERGFPTPGSNSRVLYDRQILYHRVSREAQRYKFNCFHIMAIIKNAGVNIHV